MMLKVICVLPMDILIWALMNVLNKNYRILCLLLLTGFSVSICYACNSYTEKPAGKRGDVRIMFYNVENLFDTVDDTLKNDNEFLPESERKWSKSRYYAKLNNLFKVIAAVGEKTPPEIICLSEIENRQVLQDLIHTTFLEKYAFGIVHYNSPDQRGIDVALIYRKDLISIIESNPLRIYPSESYKGPTRDILYVKAQVGKRDTIYLFVNHWPSRRSGKKDSEGHRQQVASLLRHKIDSIFSDHANANIIITGDFNDEPHDKSLVQTLGTESPDDNIQSDRLYNLSGKKQQECDCGTYRYRAEWDMFDQFIISGGLLLNSDGLHTCNVCIAVADFDFLLKEDTKYGGVRPFPTFRGPVYQGGFSDHLPIYLDIFY